MTPSDVVTVDVRKGHLPETWACGITDERLVTPKQGSPMPHHGYLSRIWYFLTPMTSTSPQGVWKSPPIWPNHQKPNDIFIRQDLILTLEIGQSSRTDVWFHTFIVSIDNLYSTYCNQIENIIDVLSCSLWPILKFNCWLYTYSILSYSRHGVCIRIYTHAIII